MRLGGDALGARPPGALARLLAWPLLLLIQLYRWVGSPLLPARCRFHPSCSSYARQALVELGAFRGGWLSARRLLRCHPFHPGGLDPVPPRPRAGAQRISRERTHG